MGCGSAVHVLPLLSESGVYDETERERKKRKREREKTRQVGVIICFIFFDLFFLSHLSTSFFFFLHSEKQ